MRYTGEIVYDYESLLSKNETEEDLMKKDPLVYCKMVCTKIAFYIKVLRKKELVRMDVEFIIDDFLHIHIMEATNIWVREASKLPRDH